MLIIRPVDNKDLDQVYQLAGRAPAGLTTLPHDRDKLREKIRESEKNLHFPPNKPGGETILFVLEDTETNEIIGTSAVFTKVGGFQPFWTYEIKSLTNECKELGVNRKIDYLEVKCDHDGPSEIGTLFLDPKRRQQNAGRFLSLSRFLFISAFPHIFEEDILAELRGTFAPDGQVTFWNAIAGHFFGIPFEEADGMVTRDKTFIEKLMPKFPIYIDLLPREVQQIIGAVAEETRPAIRLLEQEGFVRIPEVDIFDGGPVVSCKTSEIRCVKQSRALAIKQVLDAKAWESLCSTEQKRLYMVAHCDSIKDYRAVVSEIYSEQDGIILPEDTVRALKLKIGDKVRFTPLRAKSKL